MKAKNLFVLLLVLAALIGAALWSQEKKAARVASASGVARERLLDPARLNDITRFTITSGTQVVSLARAEGRWVVETLWKYPADFGKVTENLRKIADVEGGEIIRGGTDHLEEFDLAPSNKSGALLVFEDASGRPFRTIAVGSPRPATSMNAMGAPMDSGYVRVDKGPVQLVKAYLGGIPRSSDEWVDRSLIQVPLADVADVAVALTNGTSYVVRNAAGGGQVLDGLATNELTRQDTARGILSALQNLYFMNVVDPTLKDEVTGLDKPDTHRARTRDGRIVTIKAGHATETYGRFAKINVGYEKPAAAEGTTNATPDTSKEAEELNARLSPWIFVLSESDCQTLLQPRSMLVTNIPPPVVTNAAPAPVP